MKMILLTKASLTWLLILGGVLIFINLGDRPMEYDEADTAVIAQRILKYGLPLGFDGKNHVVPAEYRKYYYKENYIYTYNTWFQYYLTAASFKIFGVSTFTARLPFAVFGLFSLWLLHSFCLRHLKDRTVADLAVLLLALSVPFLVHTRFCRYFTLNIFFTLAVMDAYLLLIQRQKQALLYFILSLQFLFLSNFGVFFAVLTALIGHFLVFGFYRRCWGRFSLGLAVNFILSLPWVIYLQPWHRGVSFNWQRYIAHLIRYILYINDWFFPFSMLGLLLIFVILKKRGAASCLSKDSKWLFCFIITATLLSVSSYNQMYLRYIIHLLPLFIIFLAIILEGTLKKNKLVGWLTAILLVATNALSAMPYQMLYSMPFKFSQLTPQQLSGVFGGMIHPLLRKGWFDEKEDLDLQKRIAYFDTFIKRKAFNANSQLMSYFLEVSQRHKDAPEGLVAYLRAYAQEQDVVYTNTENLPLMFYTDLIIVRPRLDQLKDSFLPQWVVLDLSDQGSQHKDAVWNVIANGKYRKVGEWALRSRWLDQPNPDYPKFALQGKTDFLVLYQKN